MELKKIKDPWIAKEKFSYVGNIKDKLSHDKWVSYIDSNRDYFTWHENTEAGIHAMENLDQVPDNFKERVLRSLNKRQAFAEFNTKKGFYEIRLAFNDDTGAIGTTFQKKITKDHLKRLLNLANHLGAYLLNNGDEIIDESVLENL